MNKPTALNKRGNKVVIDGYKFDSQKEANFYVKFIKDCGHEFSVHPSYELIELLEWNDVRFRKSVYTPDFVVYDDDGHVTHVYDVKNSFGVYGIDPAVALRFKLFLARYKFPVEAVVVRAHDFKSKVLGTTKPYEPVVRTSVDYEI